MSKPLAVEFDHVGKMYKLYKDRKDSFLDFIGAQSFMPWYRPKVDNFWALRDVSFQLEAGSRLGIVGRNGAGKTTLLKLLTGNIAPTEGKVTVNGDVQALLEAGAGFHPEFTGYENVEAALTQAGLLPSEIKAAIEEIVDFTELGEFMNQPFKAYSAGMQARLVFTTATTIKPNILIVDEILGAGDAYFAAKSRARMRALVDSGASILLVSHALDQVLQFCDQAIWLERGKVVLRGSSLEVVKAYQEFVHELQDRQLKASNKRRRYGFRDAVEVGHFAETFILRLAVTGTKSFGADISSIELLADDDALEAIKVGAPQDSDPSQFAYVALHTSGWQPPQGEGDATFRTIPSNSVGELVFRTTPLEYGCTYALRIRYRYPGESPFVLSASRNGEVLLSDIAMTGGMDDWHTTTIPLDLNIPEPPKAPANPARKKRVQDADGNAASVESDDVETSASEPKRAALTLRRWSGEGSLIVDSVSCLDQNQRERAVFSVGDTITLSMDIRAERAGTHPLIIGIALHTLDGIVVSQNISPQYQLTVQDNEIIHVDMDYPAINLPNRRYVFSVSLHKDLDPQYPELTERYDLVSQSYEFEIVGNPPLRTSLFVLPAEWRTSNSGQVTPDIKASIET